MEKVDVGEIERRWSGLDLPDPAHPKWFSGIDAIAGANGKLDDPLSIWGVINGPFEPTWQLLSDSWVHFFILARKAPGLAKDIIDRVAGYSIEAGTGMIEHGADAIRIGDDYALNEGLMCSMATWKEFIYPYHKKLVGGLKKAGGKDFPVILHSDGNIMDILDLLVSGGIDALNPIQPGALEFKDVVDKVGRQLSMTGAFDLRYFLKPCSTEVIQEMQDEVSRLYGIIEAYNALGTRTGFCIGPSHQVQPGSDPRTFEAWARIAIERGRVSGSG